MDSITITRATSSYWEKTANNWLNTGTDRFTTARVLGLVHELVDAVQVPGGLPGLAGLTITRDSVTAWRYGEFGRNAEMERKGDVMWVTLEAMADAAKTYRDETWVARGLGAAPDTFA